MKNLIRDIIRKLPRFSTAYVEELEREREHLRARNYILAERAGLLETAIEMMEPTTPAQAAA